MGTQFNIPELRRLDVEHHLPAQANYGELQSLAAAASSRTRKAQPSMMAKATRCLMAWRACGAVNVGHGRDELVDMATQMRELPFYNTFFKTATPPTVMSAAARSRKLLGGDLQHGSSIHRARSNDTVMRMVRHHWNVSGQPKRTIFHQPPQRVSRLNNGGRARWHERYAPDRRSVDPGVEHVAQPYKFR